MRREQEDIDAVELDAVDLRVAGEVDHRVEVDERLGVGRTFADDARPGRVVELGKRVGCHESPGEKVVGSRLVRFPKPLPWAAEFIFHDI
jgi:hypothetical protein